MGVDRTDYVIYGANVGASNVSWDDFEREMEGHPEAKFDIVYDGMSGNYAYAGKIIAVSDDHEGFGDGVSLNPVDESHIAAMWEVIQAFPDLKLNMNSFGYFAVSHFS
jgi:hypothetical protein